jgi:hypothetical protein
MTTPPLIGFSATTDPATLNAQAASLAVRWRALARDTSDWAAWFHVLDEADVEAKFALDSDHATALEYAIGLMTTLAGVVHGTVQQGGDGGTGASKVNFDDGLRVLAGPGPLPSPLSG